MSEALCGGFGLSKAEVNLPALMLEGSYLNEAAARLGVAITTARTLLGHIFDKVGARRQTELVRRVVDSAAWPASHNTAGRSHGPDAAAR